MCRHCNLTFIPDVRAGPLERNRKTPHVIARSGISGAGFFVSELDADLSFSAGSACRLIPLILRIWVTTKVQAVNVLEQFLLDWCVQGIQHKINPFTARKLRRRDKVTVSGNQHDLIHLFL